MVAVLQTAMKEAFGMDSRLALGFPLDQFLSLACRGELQLRRGDLHAALAAFTAARDLDAESSYHWERLGRVYELRGEVEAAEAAYRRATLLHLYLDDHFFKSAVEDAPDHVSSRLSPSLLVRDPFLVQIGKGPAELIGQ